jgi:hypothetical protein
MFNQQLEQTLSTTLGMATILALTIIENTKQIATGSSDGVRVFEYLHLPSNRKFDVGCPVVLSIMTLVHNTTHPCLLQTEHQLHLVKHLPGPKPTLGWVTGLSSNQRDHHLYAIFEYSVVIFDSVSWSQLFCFKGLSLLNITSECSGFTCR